MSSATNLPPGTLCSPCLANGHRVQAVEYVNGPGACCIYCRDNDPCPGCETAQKQRAAAGAEETITRSQPNTCPRCHQPKHRGKCKGASTDPTKRASGAVTLQMSEDLHIEIDEDFQGAPPEFKEVLGIDVRYPTRQEVRARHRPGPKDERMMRYQQICEQSPTGCAEFRSANGTKLQSFASRIGGHLRKRSKIKFSVFQDKKNNTVIVQRRELAQAAVAGANQ